MNYTPQSYDVGRYVSLPLKGAIDDHSMMIFLRHFDESLDLYMVRADLYGVAQVAAHVAFSKLIRDFSIG